MILHMLMHFGELKNRGKISWLVHIFSPHLLMMGREAKENNQRPLVTFLLFTGLKRERERDRRERREKVNKLWSWWSGGSE
jgi:hypothetical protein